MDLKLKGRRVLVAGSSAGIGKACAKLFLAEGAEVLLVARTESSLQETARELEAEAGRVVHSIAADLSNAAGVDRAWAHAQETMGGIDVLVNNAGGPKPGTFEQLGDGDWASAVELTLMNAVRLTRHAVEGMKARGWGRIINVSSVSVKQPIEGLMLSNSIRLAVVGFAKTLAGEVGRHGVTVNTVGPGYTKTARLEQIARATSERSGESIENIFAKWESDVPVGRVGTPAEIAAAVVFLASGQAAYITGVTLVVDGGRTRAAL